MISMEYMPLLLVIIFLVFPIVVPLFYWYILKKRDSRVFTFSRYLRRFWSLVVLLLVTNTIYKNLPNFSFEVIGQVLSQIIIAFLLWKRWVKAAEKENSEMNSPSAT
jgi:hypothetical protein